MSLSTDTHSAPAAPGRVVVVAGLVATWCAGFAVVNLTFELTGRFRDGPLAAYATGIAVMDWSVFGLKLLGAAVALLSVLRLPRTLPPRLLAVLVWGAAALLALYAVGNVVEAVGIALGLTGSVDDLTLTNMAYVLFFLLGAAGYGVLAASFSRRHRTGWQPAVIGALGAPVVLGLLLVAVPTVLATAGLLPG